ncbi:MAG: hypothetical protein ACXABY_05665 [Candidatus Thorarchaeota archaeon]|jgi:hypothetical protein
MTQGLENDLLDIRFYFESTPVLWNRDNEPLEDLNENTLRIDDKAILARDTALQAQADLVAHIGQGGVPEHADGTTSVSGFLSAADKAKLDLVQDKAQLNILAPVDAIDLISRKATTLHNHTLATTTVNGFLSVPDKVKLGTIEALAQVNNISAAEASTLTSGANADALHFHSFVPGNETFTKAVHDVTNHTGLPGIAAFPGFVNVDFIEGPTIGAGVFMFSNPYNFITLDVLTGGISFIQEAGWWGAGEHFAVTNMSIVGTTGTITYSCNWDVQMRAWQGGYGLGT